MQVERKPRRPSGPLSGRTHGQRPLPVIYMAAVMLVAFVTLPSALRPPPDPTNETGALSPDAPPDDESQEQIIESVQQAVGAGAGGGGPAAATTTTTTAAPRKAGSGFCFGDPKRQTESVYSGPCVAAYSGPNGGETSKNVFANEIRLGFNQGGAPSDGRVPDEPKAGENAQTRTFRVLAQYFNQRFETYGRRVVFYGLPEPTDGTSADDQLAVSARADEEFQLFGSYYNQETFCTDFARRGLVAFCDPLAHDVYAANRPGLFSFHMDLTQMASFGAEYVCKTLKDHPAQYGGANVNGKPRRFGFLTYRNAQGGLGRDSFKELYATECDGETAVSIELASGGDASGAATAIARMNADGVTTIVFNGQILNLSSAMTAASGSAYFPEWVLLGNYSVDQNSLASTLPKDQAAHLFGLTGQELPQRVEESECYRAYKSIDPDNAPDSGSCHDHWHVLSMFMDGIQGAGPNLTPQSFQDALFRLGHRYGLEPWAIGGGYGPDDYTYMDDVAEIWWDVAGSAYRWTHEATRYRRGELTGDSSELFKSGVTAAPPGT